ncbi:hypothetical protein J7E50_10945 [Pedobacter sp. ISL-68]|uniref:hypothetical protein n=1 Tax=unclassified Pedobacter TaxID=2628915 RepID=UPI001BEB00A8|nr:MULTISPECIES: hypothetical protein [unclassified Pedobacter]MBT2561349.1 hypothetical protein [Pedobacter sp. ISL-64]MBT2590738.1 hypothetical protein [Pedobacter sp. ISL-68]
MYKKIVLIPFLPLVLLTTSCNGDNKPGEVPEVKYNEPGAITIGTDSLPVNNGIQNDNVHPNKNQNPAKIISLYDNKLEIIIPASLERLDRSKLVRKYPNANPPEIAFSNKDGSVNIAFRFNSRVTIGNDAAKLVQMMSANLKSTGIEVTSEITNVSGRDFAVVEFVSDAYNTKIYNKMVATVIDGRVMICTFNCTTGQLIEWKEIGEACLKSIRVKV